ncbi:MAG: chromosome segregation protein SMC [Lachnospiraceae bacterium]|nr:chromosome segregation protein SMC [Lachnospiraceae bacterium]
MYLKSIEVYGFKSFADKTVFRFKDGITGIVGPNGSGKSNVADAVRWVLGEQSAKQLRGSNMQDVIFSGTELRKPMGSAYVAITLDNSDHSLPVSYEELTVARRVYRSGESEYLINGSVCRRKDIVEMFFDTGIGKEGYSIIGQGQVDKILSGKPEDKRELFDEAAGIIKYKKNKLTAEKSLQKERENLDRVNDILSELTQRVGPLKNQSEKAREYLSYRDSLKTADIQAFLLETGALDAEHHKLTEDIDLINADIGNCRREYESITYRNEALEGELTLLKDKISEESAAIQEQKVEKEKLEGEIKVLKEQINTEKTKEEHYYSNVTRVEDELEDKKQELNSILRQKNQLLARKEENIEAGKEERYALDAVEVSKQETKEELDALTGNMEERRDDKTEILNKMERFATVREQLDLRIEDVESRIAKNEEMKQEAAIYYEKCSANLEKLQKEADALSEKLTEAAKKRSELIRSGNEIAMKGQDKNQELYRVQSRLETLTNMAERYDGYGNSIKKVMENRKKNPGIIGVVADIIHVDRKYELAIETALGGAIQNIVTDDQQTAKKMISYLKETRGGRATFLPLDAVKNRNPFKNMNALEEAGVIGLASTLVKAENRFRELVDSLLGRIVVVDNIDSAMALAKKYHYSLRIVSLEGDSLNPGGSMTGGAFRHSSNLLARNREIEDGRKLEARIVKEHQELEKAFGENKKAKDELDRIVAAWEKEEQERSLDINTATLRKEQQEDAVKDLEKANALLEEEKQQLISEKESMAENVIRLKEKQASLEEEDLSGEAKIQALKEALEALKEREDHHVAALNEIEMQDRTFDQRISFMAENENRISDEIKRLGFDLAELEEEEDQRENNLEAIEERIDVTKERILELEQLIEENEQLLSEHTKEEKRKNEQFKHSLEDKESLGTQVAALDKESFRLQSRKEKLEERIQAQRDYMWDNYELTYRMAKANWVGELPEDLSAVKKEVASWKSKIKKLGDININAIEEYKEVSERYEFLLAQHEDIMKAEDQLVKLIARLEREMRKQFNDKFAEIQEMFSVVFKELFGGGHAHLELTDSADVLEAGIKIIAQPPGKKLQNMMQLSGGEKALTAISLLFAIQNLKPSPFCLLDEIEAALDDSNVSRFAQYLHKLTKDTQFIVITHRKGTMTAADMLYGITMQEKGVSALVSVNLIEKDLDD